MYKGKVGITAALQIYGLFMTLSATMTRLSTGAPSISTNQICIRRGGSVGRARAFHSAVGGCRSNPAVAI